MYIDMVELFTAWAGCAPERITPFPASGSHRRYCRMKGGGRTVIGVSGTSPEENRSFIGLSRHFRLKGLPVPEVFAMSANGLHYLQEDLGDESLFAHLAPGRESGRYSAEEVTLLKKTIAWLPRFQFEGADGLPWELCYPQAAFDARTVDFDLNYFKYCFLKAAVPDFEEMPLQDDFNRLKADLLREDSHTFLYRDFQARNVMLKDGEPWFIDFQGGRRGPVHYDLASFVWQARSRFPEALREELVRTYIDTLRNYTAVDEAGFREQLRLFVLFRTLQVLGAYGYRGWFERKPHFIASIPGTLDNLRSLLPFPQYPYLNGLLQQLTEMPQFQAAKPQEGPLEVHVFSFSYKKGIPDDASSNGGGYVFDCRAIHNPGRYPEYKSLNGTDPEVIQFLEERAEAAAFLEHVYPLVDAHVERYLQRRFTHLQVSFGCTGGQHRSVYCAEHLARHIADSYPVRVVLTHRELQRETVLRDA